MLRLLLATLIAISSWAAAGARLSALIIDGMNNHDWAAGAKKGWLQSRNVQRSHDGAPA